MLFAEDAGYVLSIWVNQVIYHVSIFGRSSVTFQ